MRGYMGKWEIKGNKLFLVHLSANIDNANTVGIDFLFPGQSEVFAEWFNGEIRLQRGQMLKYVHMGYASIFEEDLYLAFQNGELIDCRIQKNSLNQ
jgi:hypothetical protein